MCEENVSVNVIPPHYNPCRSISQDDAVWDVYQLAGKGSGSVIETPVRAEDRNGHRISGRSSTSPPDTAKPGIEAVRGVSENGAARANWDNGVLTSCMPKTKKWADEGTGCEEKGLQYPKAGCEVEYEYAKTREEQEK